MNRLIFLTVMLFGTPAAAQRAVTLDSTMRFLEPLRGTWAPVPQPGRGVPPPDFVLHAYDMTVGGKAMRVRESYRLGSPENAELDGLLLWNPASEQVEFTAVAGPGPGQGRVFHGVYQRLATGEIERTYSVMYRSAADVPGEELGGRVRRYRETYAFVTGDSVTARLDWWRDGRWQPFGPGRYAFIRRKDR